ncbi:hypothetical protein PENSPDRAFT_687286 [Peniophora sp. CONT]|nr:hypothetical protein PENSPDRAFT_687286 [Peniophora sp. CONT]
MAAPPSETPSRIQRRTSLSTSKPRAGSVSTGTPLSVSTSRVGSISRNNSTTTPMGYAGNRLSADTKTGSVSSARSPSVSVADRRLGAIPTGSVSGSARSPAKHMSASMGVGSPLPARAGSLWHVIIEQ